MIEQWKDIIGYEGLYQVSNFGRVKSLERVYYCGVNHSTRKVIKEHMLVPRLTQKGYCRVHLARNGISVNAPIHRLVGFYFLENKYNYTEINHMDENKSNNHVNNLEYCTHKYNCNYGDRNKKISIANSKPRKLVKLI